jgi:hypothetical protein
MAVQSSCAACGAKISDGAGFCGACGEHVSAPTEVAAPRPDDQAAGWTCAACSAPNPLAHGFCGACGSLRVSSTAPFACTGCGAAAQPGDAFCAGCGSALSPALPRPSTPAATLPMRAVTPAPSPVIVPAAQPASSRGIRGKLIAGGAGVLLLVALAAVAFVLVDRGASPQSAAALGTTAANADPLTSVLGPVARVQATLSTRVSNAQPTSASLSHIKDAASALHDAVLVAQGAAGSLDQTTKPLAQAALSAQLAYAQAAIALPSKPSSLTAWQVQSLRRDASSVAAAYTQLAAADSAAPQMAISASDVSGLGLAQRSAAARLQAQQTQRGQMTDYLGRINSICVSSASGVSDINNVLNQLNAGQIYQYDAANQLNSTISNRSQLLGQITALPAAPSAGAGLADQLYSAVNASRQADISYQRWMGGLPDDYSTATYGTSLEYGPDWDSLTSYNQQATSAKSIFSAHFAHLAARFHVASSCGQI